MEYLYQKVSLKTDDGKGGFIYTPLNVWLYLQDDESTEDYDVTPVWMREDQFNCLPEFTEF